MESKIKTLTQTAQQRRPNRAHHPSNRMVNSRNHTKSDIHEIRSEKSSNRALGGQDDK